MFKYVFANNNKEVKNVLLFETRDVDTTEFLRSQEDLFGEQLHVIVVDEDFHVGVGEIEYKGWEFRPVKPYPSWLYDEQQAEWRAPIPHPLALYDNWEAEDPAGYVWDESVGNWVLTP